MTEVEFNELKPGDQVIISHHEDNKYLERYRGEVFTIKNRCRDYCYAPMPNAFSHKSRVAFIYTDIEIFKKNEPKVICDKYPNLCPKCKGPAWIGFSSIDCKNKCQ